MIGKKETNHGRLKTMRLIDFEERITSDSLMYKSERLLRIQCQRQKRKLERRTVVKILLWIQIWDDHGKFRMLRLFKGKAQVQDRCLKTVGLFSVNSFIILCYLGKEVLRISFLCGFRVDHSIESHFHEVQVAQSSLLPLAAVIWLLTGGFTIGRNHF